MPDLQDILNSKEAEALTRDTARLEKLRDAPETRRLFQLLGQNAGGDLEQAVSRAAKGDTGTLMDAVRQLMENPEGQRLIQQMKRSVGPVK